jgi:hypothetical protein
MPHNSSLVKIDDILGDVGGKVGHAFEVSSIKTFSKKMNLDLALSMQRLKDAGFTVKNGDQPLNELPQRTRPLRKRFF